MAPTMTYTLVGRDRLAEVPPGWPVAVDTESSGLYKDGDPISSAGRPAQPNAYVSVVSVSYKQPIWNDETGRYDEGPIVDFAWPFDQGPLIGKAGKPLKDPETGLFFTFATVDEKEQTRILGAMSKVLGRGAVGQEPALTSDDIWNWGPEHYAALIGWLDRRDFLIMHNRNHDLHILETGMRADAGGYGGAEGAYAWNADSEVGQWRPNEPQETGFMEPSNKPLQKSARRRYIYCTQIAQKQLVDPLENPGLKPTGSRLFGEDEADEAGRLKEELAKMGTGMTKRYDLLLWGTFPFASSEDLINAWAAMGQYAAKDTNLTLRVYYYEMERLEEGSLLPDFERIMNEEMELATTLYRMEMRGVAYDVEKSLAEGRRIRELNKAEAAKLPFDPTKPMQAKRFYFGPVCEGYTKLADDGLFDTSAYLHNTFFHPKDCLNCEGTNGLGIKPLSYTDKGAPQLDILTLRHLEEAGHPHAEAYMSWTKRRNADSKWYTGWAMRTGKDGRIRTSFKQCATTMEKPGQDKGGTKSGRLSATRWGAQQIPKKRLIPEGFATVRSLLNQEPGYKVYGHDLTTGEMRVAVVLAGCTKLWDALDNGADTHKMNALALFKQFGVTEDHPDFKMYREAGKGGTFCILYGGGEDALMHQIEGVTGLKIGPTKAREVKQSFFSAYPEFRVMTDQATKKVDRYRGGCGYLTMLDGWRRVYAYNEKSNSAVNQAIQGNLARCCNRWMRAVERELPGVLLLQIHDELVTRHTDDEKGRAEAARVSEIGNEIFTDYFNVRGRVMDFGIDPEEWNPDK